ncbi:hypothetical protein ACUOCP_19025 [Escherichia sp. R-CC3]
MTVVDLGAAPGGWSLCCISSSLNQARERNPFFCAC